MDNELNNEIEFMGKPPKSSNKKFFSGVVAGVCVTVVLMNFLYITPAAKIQKTNTPSSAKIQKILSVLDSNYVDSYDKEKALESMYAGLVYGVGDPYTSYLDADTLDAFMEQTEGTYAGIGVVVTVDPKDNSIMVVTPFEDYPGAKAGLLPGDKIIKVNGFDVYGEIYQEAVSMMKGEPGTTVVVSIYRESERRTFETTIVREKIDIPTVTYKMLDNNIGYIRITNFDRVTYEQFVTAYNDLNSLKIEGLIIDLRNNPGGLLDVVVHMTDLLVPKGYIVYTEDKGGKRVYHDSDEKQINVPLALLVNGNSASASEVMAGAVKDMGVGVLVGTQTYGKGLVQNLFDLQDGSAIKITIAKYYTPSGVCINGEGLTPDYIVDLPNELTTQLSALSLEEDPQLQKAIEVVSNK